MTATPASVKNVAFCPICGQVSGFFDEYSKASDAAQRHNSSNHSPNLQRIYSAAPPASPSDPERAT